MKAFALLLLKVALAAAACAGAGLVSLVLISGLNRRSDPMEEAFYLFFAFGAVWLFWSLRILATHYSKPKS